MSKKPNTGNGPWVDPDDAPALTPEYFEQADVYDGEMLIRRGRPPSGHAKKLVSLRIDPDVLERLRRLGPGWQTRVGEALRVLADSVGEQRRKGK